MLRDLTHEQDRWPGLGAAANPGLAAFDLIVATSPLFQIDCIEANETAVQTQRGHSVLDIVVQSDRRRFREQIESAIATGERRRLTARLSCSRGGRIALSITRRADRADPAAIVAGVLLEEATVDGPASTTGIQSEWYEELIQELPVSVYFKDVDGRYLHFNQHFLDRFRARTDVTADQLLGTTDFDHLSIPDAESYQHRDAQVLRGTAVRNRDRFVHEDGRVELFHSTKLPVRDPSGRVIGLMGFASEVADAADVAAELEKSERRYRLAVRASRDGIWEFDPVTVTLELSERACQLLHLGVIEDPIPLADVMLNMDRADGHAVIRAIERLMADHTELLLVRLPIMVDGEERWVQLDGAAIAEQGRTVRIIGSIADVTESVHAERQLTHLATHDDLTDLPNRRALYESLEQALEPGCDDHSLLFLDLDDFKSINDTFGHHIGDELLVQIAKRLRTAVGDDDLVVRLGGDEFAVLVPDTSGGERGRAVAETIAEAMTAGFEIAGRTLHSSASIGVVALRGHEDAERALRDADTAMYSAKASNRPIAVFKPAMNRRPAGTAPTRLDLLRAIDKKEFGLVYQPVRAVGDGAVTAMEALLRWNRPDNVVARPVDFLPGLIRSGRISELNPWLLEEACGRLAAWRGEDSCLDARISINVAVRQVLDDQFEHLLGEALASAGLGYEDLVLELDEASLTDDTEILRPRLEGLRALGAEIELDDFGTGRISLRDLVDLPIDGVKIDGSLTGRVVDGGHDALLETVVHAGVALGLRVVAEQVEHSAQAERLTAYGCTHLQGRFVGAARVHDAVERV